MLVESSVVILKFFLHVSRDETKSASRSDSKTKRKTGSSDSAIWTDRALSDEYTAAYRDAIAKCSTNSAPWYIVPADDEDARDLLIGRTIADALDDLDLRYPRLDPELKGLKIK